MFSSPKISKKRILYTICFGLLCLVDQRVKTGTGLDGWIESFQGLMGVIFAVMVLSSLLKNRNSRYTGLYLLWLAFGVAAGIAFCVNGQSRVWFLNDRIVKSANSVLYGLILIVFFTQYLDRRKDPQNAPKLPKLNRLFGLGWLLMMGLMCASGSAYHWPVHYMLYFGCFYLTDFDKSERDDLFMGMIDGFILAFFLMQGWCFAFRPYDEARYKGIYNNCNLNALFYLIVLAAVFARLFLCYGQNSKKFFKVFYQLGVGALAGFLFLTMGRTAWLTAAVVVTVGNLFLGRLAGDASWFKGFVRRGMIVIGSFLLVFPLVFGAVRLLPPVFHHPVWFFGEWSEDKVHAWDAWDSDKYVSLEKIFKTTGGRFAQLSKIKKESEITNISEPDETDLPEVTPQQAALYREAWENGYAMDPRDRHKAVLVRASIYRYYAHLLNWTGRPEGEQGFQILPNQRIGHAHNLFLQYGVDFGIPVMLLLIALVVSSAVTFLRRAFAERSIQDAAYALFLLVPAVFGLLEYMWGVGSLAVTLLFVIWRRMICHDEEA